MNYKVEYKKIGYIIVEGFADVTVFFWLNI